MKSQQVTVDVHLEPYQIADLFWSMDDSEQAMFFNRLGVIASHKLCKQMRWVSQNTNLNEGGREALRKIAAYGETI